MPVVVAGDVVCNGVATGIVEVDAAAVVAHVIVLYA